MVPALQPDVAIVAAQRADADGDTQIWGLLGCQKEVAFAATRVIVVVEEIVEESVIRRDPNRTVIPGRDRRRRRRGTVRLPSELRAGLLRPRQPLLPGVGRDREGAGHLEAWLDEWVYGTANHAEYVEKFGDAYWDALRPQQALSGEVDYGRYA